MQLELQKQLVNAIPAVYLWAIKNKNTGFSQQSVRDILTYLFRCYGKINTLEIQANGQHFLTPWDPSMPFELLIAQIEDCAEFVEAAKQLYSPAQILGTAYALVERTGLFLKI